MSSPSTIQPLEQRYRHSPDVHTLEAQDGLLLVDLVRGFHFRLNPTGKTVWELLGQGLTPTSLVHRLVDRYAIAQEQLRADVNHLITNLTNHALIEPQGEQTP